jgi:hypothetical protein
MAMIAQLVQQRTTGLMAGISFLTEERDFSVFCSVMTGS